MAIILALTKTKEMLLNLKNENEYQAPTTKA